MCADKKSVKTGGAKLREIAVGAQSGFADGDAVVWNSADQFKRSIDVDAQRLQIAIVYTEYARAHSQRPVHFFRCVNFDERLHAQLAAQSDEVAEERILQSGGDKEKAVGVIGASFPNLPGIKNKILAQNRKLHDLASIAQVFQRAPANSRACARATGSNGSRITPREGEAGFSSATMFKPSRHSAAEKSRSGVAAFTPYFSAVSGKTRLR